MHSTLTYMTRAAKAAAALRQASALISQLTPDQRERLAAEIMEAKAAYHDEKMAVMAIPAKHQTKVSERRAHEALDTDDENVNTIARKLLSALSERPDGFTATRLARLVGMGADDDSFTEALQLLRADDYILRPGTEPSAKLRVQTPQEILGLPQTPKIAAQLDQLVHDVVEHLNARGVAKHSALWFAVSAPSNLHGKTFDDWLNAALVQAMASHEIQWVGHATFALPSERLEQFVVPESERPTVDAPELGDATRRLIAATRDLSMHLAEIERATRSGAPTRPVSASGDGAVRSSGYAAARPNKPPLPAVAMKLPPDQADGE